MLGATWDGPGALPPDLLLDSRIGGTGVYIDGVGRLCDVAVQLVCCDQFALALVPGGQDLGRGSTAQDSGVNQAGKLDVWDMARGALYGSRLVRRKLATRGQGMTYIDTLEVPNSFGTAVRLGQSTCSQVARKQAQIPSVAWKEGK
jgi:hypothetical protein